MRRYWLAFLYLSLFCANGISQTNTNVGTEFWMAFPPNSSPSAVLQIYISSEFNTTGTITSAFAGYNQNFSVTPGIVTQITLPNGFALGTGTENKGIHIVANDPIAVYGLNNASASTDAFMTLPVTSLGIDYFILSYQTSIANGGSCFSVVATQDGTNLTIFNHQTGMTFTIGLNTGETYHLEAPNMDEDLTGSRIQSNFPVAVYGSVDIARVPTTCSFGDHIVEQMFPVNSWGLHFVTVPLAGRDNSGDIFRIVASDDNTNIEINGTVVKTLNLGDHFDTLLTGYNSINSSKATLLAQFAKGEMCSGGVLGDPFMMLILPREQYLKNYTVINVAGVTPFNFHYVNLVAPSYALNSIYEDGVLLPASAFVPIGTTGYYGAQRTMTQGSHTYNSVFPFGVSVYGWRTVDSYGYPGGGSMSPVGTVASVTITPDTTYAVLNVTNVCLTAHVTDNFSDPVVGVLVNFNISGITPIVGSSYTNTSGDAQYCYTQYGAASGTDHIYADCFNVLSDTAVVFWAYNCSDPVNGGSVAADQSGCEGFTPQPILSTALPSGQDGTLEYMWQQSVIDGTTGFTDIPGTNFPDHSPGSITQTTWFRRLARVSCSSDWSTAAVSNVVQITALPILPVSVSISSSANNVCAGTTVTFTASPLNEGTNPSYQWQVNGVNTGTGGSVHSYIPLDNDIITCILTSSENCSSGNPAVSNALVMNVDPVMPVSISITATPNPFCAGSNVVVSTSVTNGGALPVYQWIVNGINTGTNFPSYSFNPANNDSIRCILTSSLSCTSNNPASSGKIILTSLPLPVVTFPSCFDTMTTSNAKPIKLRGGIPPGGTYSGAGVSGGYYVPSVAGPGAHTITYTVTNSYSCTDYKTLRIHQFAAPVFSCGNTLTDIRDNKIYQTVQIGSQCWMAEDLRYGTQIPQTQHQRDNCTSEAYCLLPTAYFYQWDELMNYDETPGNQGLCPPAWHLPTEAEWQTLFANWVGSGFAGAPLKSTGYSGFDALLTGVSHQNIQLDYQGFATFFWSSSSHGSFKAWAHGMNSYDPSVALYPSSRSNAFSVRCLKD